jgi:hypothetical protein
MKVPSLSRGCEIAPFFVRHTAGRAAANLEGNKPSGAAFRRTLQGREYSSWAKKR